MPSRLDFAACSNPTKARVQLFGANTQGAGFSQSARGQDPSGRALFSGDFIRGADNESPSLTEGWDDGALLHDGGNLELAGLAIEAQVERVRGTFRSLFQQGQAAVCLGGDHFIKYAGLAALSDVFPSCGILYFDAHPDCAQDDKLYYGSVLHHAWRLPNILPSRTSIVGLRQVNASERKGLLRWRPGVVRASELCESSTEAVCRSLDDHFQGCETLYLSVDLDGFTPAEVPAVEAPYPGGPTVQMFLSLMHALSKRYRLVGMDITEFIPELDPAKSTALACARLIKEFYAACLPR